MLGGLYGVAQILQTAGLAHTAASGSGFITGMYVVFTPLLAAVLLRSRIGGPTWVAVLLAVTGLGVLTLGDVSAGLGAWSDAGDALGMSIVQCIVIAVVCTGAAAPGGIVLPQSTGDRLSVVYMAVVAGAAGLLGQTGPGPTCHRPAPRSS